MCVSVHDAVHSLLGDRRHASRDQSARALFVAADWTISSSTPRNRKLWLFWTGNSPPWGILSLIWLGTACRGSTLQSKGEVGALES